MKWKYTTFATAMAGAAGAQVPLNLLTHHPLLGVVNTVSCAVLGVIAVRSGTAPKPEKRETMSAPPQSTTGIVRIPVGAVAASMRDKPDGLRGLYGMAPQEIHFHSEIDLATSGLRLMAEALDAFPDPAVPTTMGLRFWVYDEQENCLLSPHLMTPWRDPDLRCEAWVESDAVRGTAGIHAHLVPFEWEKRRPRFLPESWSLPPSYVREAIKKGSPSFIPYYHDYPRGPVVYGTVERFGNFVLGSEGWRAEWVMIRKLKAPSRAIALALKEAYPEVEVV